MLKNISIIAAAIEPESIEPYIKKVIGSSRYRGQIQFVFFVLQSQKAILSKVHELYMKYAPSLFDEHPVPMIKLVSESGDILWEDLCRNRCDAKEILTVAQVDKLIATYPTHWDMHYLDSIQNKVA